MWRRAVWLWNRLSVMGPSEVVSRLADQWTLLKLSRQYRPPPAALPDEPPASSRAVEFAVAPFNYCASALAHDYPMLLEGHLTYGGGEWQFDQGAATWHTEFTTLQAWPQTFFNAVDYRPGNATGDVRRSWEPARLQQLVALAVRPSELAIASSEAQSELALALIERQLISWWTHNPILHGIHSVSAMECGLRCLSLAHMAALLEQRGRLTPVMRAIVLATLDQHGTLIRQRISTHSSAGNHTLAECAGLIYVALLCPERDASTADLSFAVSLFSQEFDRQVLPDGGGIEQATWYHRFNVELAECVMATLEVHQQAVPATLSAAWERAARFLKTVSLDDGDVLRVGDADDGYALSPYYRGRWQDLTPSADAQTFPDTGMTHVARGGWRVLVQHGPLGMPPSFGHGHADGLSLTVRLNDVEVLCDAGTGAYAGENAGLRAHFRSCAAHNTVQLGTADFSRALSPFMWTQPYACYQRERQASGDVVELWLELVPGVTPTARISRYLRLSPEALVVIDRVQTDRPVEATQRWHIPSTLALETGSAGELHVREPALRLQLGLDEPAEACVQSGQRSARYGEIDAVHVVSQSVPVSTEACMGFCLQRLDGVHAAADAASPRTYLSRAKEFFA